MHIIAAKPKRKTPSSQTKMMDMLQSLAENHRESNEQVMQEVTGVRQELQEMKEMLNRINVRPSGKKGGIFSRRPRQQVNEPPAKSNTILPLEELLPLLPQLGGMIPQLNNPKMAETLKILSNPAISSMIQQFISNGGLSALNTKVLAKSKKRVR